MTLTGLEVQLYILRQNAVEECGYQLTADIAAGNLKSKRVDTLVKNVKCFCIGSFSIVDDDVLTDKPKVVVFLVTTNEREFAWQRINGFEVF